MVLGTATVGTLGLIATGAAATLLLADGTHYAFEVADKKFHVTGAAEAQAWIGHFVPYKIVEWISPILCLPDMVANLPGSIREAGAAAPPNARR